MNDTIIDIKSLHKTYYTEGHGLEVLKGIDLSIHRGEIASIVGESGSGKSTLLNLIGGLDRPTSGSILMNEKNIDTMSEDELSLFRNRHVGFIFQFHHLLPDFTALENIMLPYLVNRFNKKDAREKAMSLLKQINLEARADHRPNQLSGGEQQRIAIARGLINDPDIIFADEPTGNLDEKTSNEIQSLLWDLREKHNLTILLVTHNLTIANQADRIVRLAYGRVDEISSSKSRG
ncbi:MAG: ABC transporter ATP-binding protein [Spirochaetota bacterium]|nr:ABC transporter ATP-binding protein [Spirochaetota bacterium]